MKQFENKLDELNIDKIETPVFRANLRRDLESQYFQDKKSSIFRKKLSFIPATVLSILLISFIIKPELPKQLNQFIFRQKVEISEDITLENIQQNLQLQYTSIHNPSLIGEINPNNFIEDKAYLIRKYNSPQDGSILIVSEFGDGFNKQIITQKSM